jgi:hypothetical protein
MSRKLFLSALCAVAFCWLLGAAAALAQQPATVGNKEALLRKIEAVTAKVRGLPFKNAVTYNKITRDEFEAFVKREIREQYSEDAIVDISRSMALMGLIPEGTNIETDLLKLMRGQVAAFYDPKKKAVFEFDRAPQIPAILWQVLAHELTHTLQDQHYNMLGYPEMTIKDNDDRQRAFQSLFEGDATVVMPLALKEAGMPPAPAGIPPRSMGTGAFLQNQLVFPYTAGASFARALYQRANGFELIDRAYKDLPRSTEQILHPEKYFDPAKRDDPVEVMLPPLNSKNWRLLDNNVFGEFGIRELFLMHLTTADPSAVNAAAGWGGDRYNVYGYTGGGTRKGQEPMGAWWSAVWDTNNDAAEFDNALRAYLHRRYTDIALKSEDKSKGVAIFENARWRIQISRTGNKVNFIKAPPHLFDEFSGLVEKAK